MHAEMVAEGILKACQPAQYQSLHASQAKFSNTVSISHDDCTESERVKDQLGRWSAQQ